MKIELLKQMYQHNNISEEDFNLAQQFLLSFNRYITENTHFVDIDDIDTTSLDLWIQELVRKNDNSVIHFIIMMRYYRVSKNHHLFIHLTKYTDSLDVIESMIEKLEKVVGNESKKMILNELDLPYLGMDLIEINHFTEHFVNKLKLTLTPRDLKMVLTDNHHQIPKKAFSEERIIYESMPTFELYLKDLHKRKVMELEQYYKDDKVWFEQLITPDVIDFVKNNQEIMSGVIENQYLYITKIPYDTNLYIKASTSKEKAYHACHCPFAKESILKEKIHVDPIWCYCSAGFTKLPFEVALDQELDIECISTALNGDPICRFRIPLEHVNYKK